MDGSKLPQSRIALGDPVPWFSAPTVTGGSVDLHVDAGRWVVLAFLGSLDEPRAMQELSALLKEARLFDEDRIVVYGVLTAPPHALQILASISGPALAFIADYDGELSRRYGALGAPRTIILDPMLRAIADIGWDHPAGHATQLRGLLNDLPSVDDSAGVPMTAPALIVPRVFDFPLCDLMMRLYDHMGGEDSGFLLDHDGKTATVINHQLKRRQDLVISAPELRDVIRERIVTRLLPAIERFFQFRATRMDRTMVCCYDSRVGGHFFRHRDNLNAGAQHRRFAVSINLNSDFDGCDLRFPEFGRRTYRPPAGGAVVFSCGALHEVTPVTRGRRFAFVPFLYGEEDATLRERNNALLAAGEAHYTSGYDRLFPLADAKV
jgi:peroxiredoxin